MYYVPDEVFLISASDSGATHHKAADKDLCV
jgi:hypothetical protein